MLFREIIQDVIKKLRTWTIFATLRLSLEMLSLQSLQEERFDFAYSALYSKSSAILFWDWIRKETGSGPYFAFDWLKFRANFLTSMWLKYGLRTKTHAQYPVCSFVYWALL